MNAIQLLDLNSRYQTAAMLVLLLIMIDFYRNRHLKLISTKCFIAMLWLTLINLVLDVLTVYALAHIAVLGQTMNRLLHQLFISSVIMGVYFQCLYVVIRSDDQQRPSKKDFILLNIPLVISVGMIIFGKLNYNFASNAAYSYGPMADTVYICGFIYLAISFFKTVNMRSALTKNERFSIVIGMFIWLGTLVIQIIYPWYLISGFGFVLMLLSIYFSFENQREQVDVQVDCFNAFAFERMLGEYYASGKDTVLITMTCKNIHRITEAYGSNEGMRVLINMSKALTDIFSTEVFKTGDSSFSVFTTEPVTEKDGRMIAVQKKFADSNTWKQHSFAHFDVIDLGTLKPDQNDVSELMRFMQHSEQAEHELISILDEEGVKSYNRRGKILACLNHALAHDGFEMFYQPIYDTKSKKFHSGEALLRLKDTGDLGFISPEEFIPIAEKQGLIIPISDKVFAMTAAFIAENRLKELGVHYIEVNLSRAQAVTEDIAGHIKGIITKYGVPTACMNIEITETATICEDEVFDHNIRSLRKDGFGISVDDFGTGYSNFSQILQMHYDLIKLDKSLIWPAFDEGGESAKKLLVSLIEMLLEMNVSIVAEGVETQEMADFLISYGVQYIQGYYYSKPIPGNQFVEFICKENNTAFKPVSDQKLLLKNKPSIIPNP